MGDIGQTTWYDGHEASLVDEGPLTGRVTAASNAVIYNKLASGKNILLRDLRKITKYLKPYTAVMMAQISRNWPLPKPTENQNVLDFHTGVPYTVEAVIQFADQLSETTRIQLVDAVPRQGDANPCNEIELGETSDIAAWVKALKQSAVLQPKLHGAVVMPAIVTHAHPAAIDGEQTPNAPLKFWPRYMVMQNLTGTYEMRITGPTNVKLFSDFIKAADDFVQGRASIMVLRAAHAAMDEADMFDHFRKNGN